MKTITFASKVKVTFSFAGQAAMRGNNNKTIIIKRHLFKNNFVQLEFVNFILHLAS